MAEVTLSAVNYRHVLGDMVMRVFKFTGPSGSTLTTGMRDVLWWGTEPGSLITAITDSAGVLTITASNTMTGEVLLVLGRKG